MVKYNMKKAQSEIMLTLFIIIISITFVALLLNFGMDVFQKSEERFNEVDFEESEYSAIIKTFDSEAGVLTMSVPTEFSILEYISLILHCDDYSDIINLNIPSSLVDINDGTEKLELDIFGFDQLQDLGRCKFINLKSNGKIYGFGGTIQSKSFGKDVDLLGFTSYYGFDNISKLARVQAYTKRPLKLDWTNITLICDIENQKNIKLTPIEGSPAILSDVNLRVYDAGNGNLEVIEGNYAVEFKNGNNLDFMRDRNTSWTMVNIDFQLTDSIYQNYIRDKKITCVLGEKEQ